MLSRISLISQQTQKSQALLLKSYKNHPILQNFSRCLSKDNRKKAIAQNFDESDDQDFSNDEIGGNYKRGGLFNKREENSLSSDQESDNSDSNQQYLDQEEITEASIEEFYKNMDLNEIAKEVVNEMEPDRIKLKEDFYFKSMEEFEKTRFRYGLTSEELKQREKEDIQYYKNAEQIYNAPVEIQAEIYAQRDYGKLQNELVAMIREKIDNGDRKRAKMFVTKLQKLLESNVATLKIDEASFAKIEELFMNRKNATDLDVMRESYRQENLDKEKVAPSIEEYKEPEYIPLRDTFKDEPVSYANYDEFVLQAMIDANNLDKFYDPIQQETPGSVMTDSRDYYNVVEDRETEDKPSKEFDELDPDHEYAHYIQGRKDDFDAYEHFIEDEIIQASLIQMEDQYRSEPTGETPREYKSFEMILNSITVESSTLQARLDEQYQVMMAYKGINHDEKPQEFKPPEERGNLKEKEMAELGQSLQQQEEMYEGVTNELKEKLEIQFEQTKEIMTKNIYLRKSLISKIRSIRLQVSHLLDKNRKLEDKILAQTAKHTGEVNPGGYYNFSSTLDSMNKQQQYKELLELIKTRPQISKLENVVDFNNELKLLIQMYEVSKDGSKERKIQVTGIELLFDDMRQNNIKPNDETRKRIFEYAVISKQQELANQKLKEVLMSYENDQLNIISPTILEKFYKQSLRTDNFVGLANIINYVEKIEIDISSWALSQFKSALDFYLNTAFDLSKLLTFSRYYTYLNECRLNRLLDKEYEGKAIDQLDDAEKKQLNAQLFSESDQLIDMRSLFGVLVDRVGEKDAVDPFTKQDVLWNLIDFFTKRGMADLMQRGETLFSSLSEKDIAQYFKNHINSSKTFERVTNVVLRFDGKGESLQNQLIQILKEYQANNNGSLPFSFEPHKARSTYIRLRNASKSLENKVGEKTLEYFLDVFQGLKMWPEIVDLTQNYHTLTGMDAGKSELRQHYLTNALLNIPRANPNDRHYNQIIKSQVFNGNEELNAAYVTNMTKAHLKDGALSHGVQFFADSVQKMGDLKKKREEYLVRMFDEVFGQEAAQELTLEQFKDKYLQTILLSEQSLKEAKAYTTLKDIVQDKDYGGIDRLLSLYLVQSEERSILQKAYDNLPSEEKERTTLDDLQDLELLELTDVLNESERSNLYLVRERKEALKNLVDLADYERVMELKNIMGDKQFEIMSGLKTTSSAEIKEMFNIKSKEEVIDMIDESYYVYEAARHMTDKSQMTVMDSFHQTQDQFAELDDEIYRSDILYSFQPKNDRYKINHVQKSMKESAQIDQQSETKNEQDQQNAEKDVSLKSTQAEKIRTLEHAWKINYEQEKEQFYRHNRLTPELLSSITEEELQRAVQKNYEPYLNQEVINVPDDVNDELLESDNEQELFEALDQRANLKNDLLAEGLQTSEDEDPYRSNDSDGDGTYIDKDGNKKQYRENLRLVPDSEFSEEDEEEELSGEEEKQSSSDTDDEDEDKSSSGSEELSNSEDDVEGDFEDILDSNQKAKQTAQMLGISPPTDEEQYEDELNDGQVQLEGGILKRKGKKIVRGQKSKLQKAIQLKAQSGSSDSEVDEEKIIDHYMKKYELDNSDGEQDLDSDDQEVLDLIKGSGDEDNYELNGAADDDGADDGVDDDIEDDSDDESEESGPDEDGNEMIEDFDDLIDESSPVIDKPLIVNEALFEDLEQSPFIGDDELFELDDMEDDEEINLKLALPQMARTTWQEHSEFDEATYAQQERLENSDPNKQKIDMVNDDNLHNNYLLFEDPVIENQLDDENRIKSYHNCTIIEMQEELLEAINQRRQDVLEITVHLFNKMQDKLVPRVKLNKLNYVKREDGQILDQEGNKIGIAETLELCQKLLDDPESPLISALNTFGRYKSDQIETNFGIIMNENGGRMENSEFDLEFELIAQKHLLAMNEKLKQLNEGLSHINTKVIAETANISIKKQILKKKSEQEKRTQRAIQELDEKIQKLYSQYQEKVRHSQNIDYAKHLSREAKLDLLSDLFTHEFKNGSFTNNVFPSYYSQDLIIFGLQHNIPEAIRLGEQMMSQNGQRVPHEMAVAVREYMLNNQDKYRNAMKYTGPIDNASIYKSVANRKGYKDVAPPMMVVDDPYWQNKMKTTYKRSEAWQRPSAYAFNYKKKGFISEIAPHLTEDYLKKQALYINSLF